MPETSWNRIRSDTPLPQATVNYVGEGWHNPDHNDARIRAITVR